MKITTPNGTLEGDNIEAILEKYGRDCLSDANLSDANLSDANLSGADLSDADLS
ncbi:pentapeptide repeat-containing protein, partial [Bifidobacterium adolescentis]